MPAKDLYHEAVKNALIKDAVHLVFETGLLILT